MEYFHPSPLTGWGGCFRPRSRVRGVGDKEYLEIRGGEEGTENEIQAKV